MKKVKRRHFLRYFVLLITLVTMAICYYFEINPFRDHSKYEPWESVYLQELEVGDIVFRTAYGKESRLIQLVSGGDYSHIAVITEITPEIKVTHATTNDHPEKINQVLLTPIVEFLSPTFAKTYLIARPDFLSMPEKSYFAGEISRRIGEPYVLKSRSLGNLYCTTLLEAPLRTLMPDLTLKWQSLQVPGMPGDYLFPDAFLEIDGIRPILKDDIWLR